MSIRSDRSKVRGPCSEPKRIQARKGENQAKINFKRPTCVRELRQFLGMSGFYRKFIENYSHEIVPLCSLPRKNAAFNWSSECEAAFQYLKEQLMNPDTPQSQRTIFLKRPNLRARLRADLFLSSFSKLKFRECIFSLSRAFYFKNFPGQHAPGPLKGSGTASQPQKPSYGPGYITQIFRNLSFYIPMPRILQ